MTRYWHSFVGLVMTVIALSTAQYSLILALIFVGLGMLFLFKGAS